MNPYDNFELYEFCAQCSVEDFSKLNKDNPQAKILENKEAIRAAAIIGNIDLLRYFFTSNETQAHHKTYYSWLDELIAYTAQGGRLEPIKYLCISSELNQKPDLSYKNNDAFKTACVNEYVDIVHFLLRQKISLTPETEDWLSTTPYSHIYDEAKMLSDIEQSFEDLNKKIKDNNKPDSIKRKI